MTRQAVALAHILSLVACTQDRHIEDDPGDLGERSCDDLNWRAGNAGELACPGVSGCSCGGADICCVTADVASSSSSATCSSEATCRNLAFTCDGPEDCGSEEVCCAIMTSGGGSSCIAPSECFGLDEHVMCRSDDDCESLEHCTPAAPGTFFDGKAALCTF